MPFVPAPSLDAVKAGTAVLQVGQEGPAVARMQLLLGVFDDGKFGQNTRRAVIAFQQSSGIPQSSGGEGTVDRAALNALEQANSGVLASVDKIDKRNKRLRLHPKFRARLADVAEALDARGMQALITDGFRSFAEQDILFNQGRTTPGPIVTGSRGGLSNHNYGLAVDMYPVIDGRVFTDTPKGTHAALAPRFREIQQAIIDVVEGLGLTSGVHFHNLVDTPHVQLLGETTFRTSRSLEIFNSNGRSFDAVWAEATRLMG